MTGEMIVIDESFRHPWLHELFDLTGGYRWITRNQLMRHDGTGVEISYRPRWPEDVICGAEIIKPGMPGATAPWWYPVDPSQDHDAVCTVVGEHDEIPHIGVPADCARQTCDCYRNGSYHLVIVGFAIRLEVKV